MLRKTLGVAVSWGLALGANAQTLTIDHTGVTCMVADRFPRLEASLSPGDEVGRARIHFRPEGGVHWYSVPLAKEGTAFAGVLPKPLSNLKGLDYYMEAVGTSLGTTRTKDVHAVVESGPAACKDKAIAKGLGSATVSIQGPAGVSGAPLVPAGFSPSGVVAAAEPASSATASSPSGAGGKGAAAGTGMSGTTLGLLVGGGALLVGGVAAAASGGGDSKPSTGGTSSGPGTCTAAPITSSLANAPTALRCGEALTVGIVVTNGSCSTLSIQSVVLNHGAPMTETCQGVQSQFTYNPTLTALAPGQSGTVLAYRSDPYCCPGGRCPTTTTCPFNETFSVQTSAGAVPSGTVFLQVSYDPSCPVCVAAPGR